MTQTVANWLNSEVEFAVIREQLGMRWLDVDEEHVTGEIHATSFNKLRGYFTAVATAGMVDALAGTLANHDAYMVALDSGAPPKFARMMTETTINFTGNTRSDLVIGEARWATRGDTQSTITTEIRDGDLLLMRATSTHRDR